MLLPAIVAGSSCFGVCVADVHDAPPNFLIFIADDAGMDFGCYGNPGIRTPAIDRLASEGMRFDRVFLTAPRCSPSRTSMLSGMFPHTIGTDLFMGRFR